MKKGSVSSDIQVVCVVVFLRRTHHLFMTNRTLKAIIRRLLTAEAWSQSQVSPSGFSGYQLGTRTDFLRNISISNVIRESTKDTD